MDAIRRHAFVLVTALASAGAPAFAGCKGDAVEPDSEQTVGEEVEEAGEEAGDAIEEAGDEVDEAQ